MKTALILQHVAFEDAGTLGEVLVEAGFTLETQDSATADFSTLRADSCDFLVILGGPIGVYEREIYPFLDAEMELIRRRVELGLPLIGICLGAQLMAAALGGRVYPGANGKEIGWHPIQSASDAAELAELLEPGVSLLHWHGDTFDLPPGAKLLASTDKYPHQAFTVGRAALGLQFHPEVTALGLERWFVGHACELAHAGLSVPALRAATRNEAPRLQNAARRFWRRWIAKSGD